MLDWSHLNAVERSAVMTFLWRAAESQRVDRLFTDKVAEEAAALIPPWPFSPLSVIFSNLVALRTWELDCRVSDEIDRGLEQIVVIGAGLDTRFTRICLPATAAVIELDSMAVNNLALKLLPALPLARREVALIPSQISYALEKAAYNPNRPTLWIAEGVLEYLPGQLWKRLAKTITEHSVPGSRAFITVLGENLPHLFAADPTFPFRTLPSLTRIVADIPDSWVAEILPNAEFRDVPANTFFTLSMTRPEPVVD